MADVVIVGAGPTGLTAALELAYRGVDCVVLDAHQQRPDGSRAIANHRATLEVWERLGCVDPMLEEGIAWRSRHTFHGDRKLHTQVMPNPGPDVLPTFLNLQQHRVEDVLIRQVALEPRIDLRWEHRVLGVCQDADGVTLDVEAPDGSVQLRAGHVLACDGARSTLRRLLDLAFPGTTYTDRFLIADIRAELPLPHEPRFYFDHHTNPGSTILIHPQPGQQWRIDWQLGADLDDAAVAAERTPEALHRRITALLGEVSYELVWLSDYRFHQRQLDQLTHGRIFFLGDAAHLMAPFGARGMNSAIADVANLGWKLAKVVRGEASATLLETYQAERWPAHRLDQQVTNATMRFMAPRTPLQRAWRSAVLSLSRRVPKARTWVNSGRMAESFTYQRSPILVGDDVDARGWTAPATGAMAPDAACVLRAESSDEDRPDDNVTRLRRFVGTGFVALYFVADDPAVTAAFLQVAGALERDDANNAGAAFTALPVTSSRADAPAARVLWDHEGELRRAFAAQPGTLVVIRPDGHIAARRRRADPAELAEMLRVASGATLGAAIPAGRARRSSSP